VPKRSDTALDWLLEENQPSIRYLALTQLLDRPENDGEVQIAKEIIGKTGWAADILGAQKPGGWWVSDERLYQPKYTSTNWMLLILSDLGLTKADPRIARACELWIERFATPDMAIIRRSGARLSGSSNTETRTVVGAAGEAVGTSTRGRG